MDEIKVGAIPGLLESAYTCRRDVVLCLLGKPGIGKTQQIYQFAQRKGVRVVEIIASQILPNEVSGITMPVNETHSMEVYDHARLSSLKDGDILFFDELLQASTQTLSACLTLIQERRLMSGQMLPDVMIVAAANEVASASMIPQQIRQRFMFVPIKWEADEWKRYNEQQLGIKITDSIVNAITFRDNGYNTLTPRTMSKLLEWWAGCNEEQRAFCADAINSMFGVQIVKYIEEAFDTKDWRSETMKALRSIGFVEPAEAEELDGLLKYVFDGTSIKDVYAKLQESSLWPRIEQAMAMVQF